jgi:uroporphyrin-III C-methyltransferase
LRIVSEVEGKEEIKLKSLQSPLAAGEVALVGAGPGDAGLLTLAAAKLIGDCDVIVHDALISDAVMEMATADAEKISVGKRGGKASAKQQDICDLLVRLAKDGKRVVRLKGGDPFVFGRGGDEVRALAAHGICFRVIPGITAGVAAPAMAGIPVTDHAVNETVAFLTGHDIDAKTRLDWKALVDAFPVLILYMAARNLTKIANHLLQAGLDGGTPLAVIYSVCRANETVNLGTIKEAADGNIKAVSPSIIIIGDVVSMGVPWREE